MAWWEMKEVFQKSVLARGDQDWLFGGGISGIYWWWMENGCSGLRIDGCGETLLSQHCWSFGWRPVVVDNKGEFILDQGKILRLLPFASVAFKIKKKKKNFRVRYSNGILHENWSINLIRRSTVENLNSIVELNCIQWELMIDWVWVIRKVYPKVPWLIE